LFFISSRRFKNGGPVFVFYSFTPAQKSVAFAANATDFFLVGAKQKELPIIIPLRSILPVFLKIGYFLRSNNKLCDGC
jgi:hypothetical protein